MNQGLQVGWALFLGSRSPSSLPSDSPQPSPVIFKAVPTSQDKDSHRQQHRRPLAWSAWGALWLLPENLSSHSWG